MKLFTSLLACIMLTNFLFAAPAKAQSPEGDAGYRAACYQQLKDIFFSKCKSIIHTMMGAPATKDTIELKDQLHLIAQLEQDYAYAKSQGLNSSALAPMAERYVDLVGNCYEIHNRLYGRIESDVQALSAVIDRLNSDYLDFASQEKQLYEDRILDVRNEISPVSLGVDRVQELFSDVQQAVNKRRQSDPNFAPDLSFIEQELIKAALHALDRRTTP